jgi:DNA polymerase type B, organellar and viral.
MSYEFEFLEPMTGPARTHDIATFDIESKDEDTQKAGFTRPFLVGFYDGIEYRSFRDDAEAKKRDWQDRAISPGGCIDRFMTWLLYSIEGRAMRGRIIYGHNAGNFDTLFALPWLRARINEFEIEVLPIQSTVVELKIRRRSDQWNYIRKWLTEYLHGIQVNETYKLRITAKTDLESIQKMWSDVPDAVLQGYEKWAKRHKAKARRGWIIRDSVRLVPRTLASLTETFEVQRKEAEFNLNTPEEDPHWERYNEIDCVALHEGMTRFHEIVENLQGEVRTTAPGTAMALFRRAYLKQRVPRHAHWSNCTIEERTKKKGACEGCLHEWMRQAVHGGRTEIFRMRGENLRYYDLNSSYAAAMLEPMPAGNKLELDGHEDFWAYQRRNEKGKPIGKPMCLPETHIGFLECTVEIPDTCFLPPLPTHEGGKLIFRNGLMAGVWTWKELELLSHPKVNGRIVSIRRSVWIEGRAIFQGMMRDLYKYRDKKKKDYNEGLSETAKLMCNSVFGKTIMRPDRRKVVFRRPVDSVPEGAKRARVAARCKNCRGLGIIDGATCPTCHEERLGHVGRTLEPIPDGASLPCHDGLSPTKDMVSEVYYLPNRVRASYIIPQIGAHITALARITLWKYMMQVLELGGELFYADTDSCICTLPEGKELPVSAELGAMKEEYPGHRLRGTFLLPKLYDLEDMDGRPLPKAHFPTCKGKCGGCGPRASQGKHEKDCKGKCKGCSTHTIAAKGIPREFKTLETLEALTGVDHGKWSSRTLWKGRSEGRVLEFKRLEKFGRLAQADFARMPRMETVKKSMQSDYNKRLVFSDGSTLPHAGPID